MTEEEVFNLIKQLVDEAIQAKQKPVRVAINGIEGTGKTVFAQRFNAFLNQNKTNSHHISIDGFHFNKEHRYRQGRNSAKGYYEDSYDEMSFVKKVLVSSQEENPLITEATHDLETDQYLDLEPISISKDTVLITDGAYLFKPSYRPHWDLKIYLKTDFSTALLRGVKRDAPQLGGLEASQEKFENRYHKASRMYNEANSPEELADIVIDNTDFEHLKICKNTLSR